MPCGNLSAPGCSELTSSGRSKNSEICDEHGHRAHWTLKPLTLRAVKIKHAYKEKWNPQNSVLQKPLSDPSFCFIMFFLSLPTILYILLTSLLRNLLCSSSSCSVQRSCCGLHNRGFMVRFQAGTTDFPFPRTDQTGYGAHQASCSTGTGSHFPGG